MKDVVAPVKNVTLLADAGNSLIGRGPGVPGIGAIWGQVGLGKTTAAIWYANRVKAIYVRAYVTWTPTSMLAAIMRELDAAPHRHCAPMIEYISQALTESQRPLFVDECNQIVTNKRVIETLRDLHDVTQAPLILIGTDDFKHHLVHRPQLKGRVAQWVEFRRPSREDAVAMVGALCEVEIADDLLDDLYLRAGSNLRELRVGLHQIEKLARREGKKKVTLADWGSRPFTLRPEA